MDPSILGAGGSADPMIRLHLSGEREKTLIKRKTLAPVWEETFALKCDFNSEVLELTLWDFDVTSANDEIGAVYVPVASLQDRQLHRAWYPVGPVASEDGLVDNLEPISRRLEVRRASRIFWKCGRRSCVGHRERGERAVSGWGWRRRRDNESRRRVAGGETTRATGPSQ